MVDRQSKVEAGKDGGLFWRNMLAAHEASGLTARRFCEAEGLAVWRFYYWRKKLRVAIKSDATNEVRFRQVGEISPVPDQLRIEFSDGVFLHVPDHYDPSRLQQVIALLRDHTC